MMSLTPMGKRPASRLHAIVAIVLIAGVGPSIGLALAAFRLVLAPPRAWLSSIVYMVPLVLCLPLGLLALWRRWLKLGGVLAALAASTVTALFYLALIGPWLPGGMTRCEEIDAAARAVTCACESTSSDDPDYSYAFELFTRPGRPIARLVPVDD